MYSHPDDPRRPLPRNNYSFWPHGQLVARAYQLERQIQALQEQLEEDK